MAVKDPRKQQRRREQLDYFRNYPHREIRTGRLREWNGAHGYGPKRSTARDDLRAHQDSGHLIGHGPTQRRRYRTAKQAAS